MIGVDLWDNSVVQIEIPPHLQQKKELKASAIVSRGPALATVADNIAAETFGSVAARNADTRSAAGSAYSSVSDENM